MTAIATRVAPGCVTVKVVEPTVAPKVAVIEVVPVVKVVARPVTSIVATALLVEFQVTALVRS